ncbi:hypothetical protein PR202_ga21441 [Eleusine coracana subsp. coracana]|uniref:Uncharacterized protein n=1 Tax=Eleusine coracana subsp. coracana TaxID=191504 RepID=A0AAV5D0J2_ELECO|nr:hypothetical protein PR202_ga21441 [Eleusine coracana subsp. coracana]
MPPGLLHGSFRFLILSNNRLTGEIPEDYGTGDIDAIDLSHNQLNGNPSFLFDAAKPMTKIDLSWNELGFDMAKVRFPYHLTYLDLSHNRITGRVAKALKDIKLRHFNAPVETEPYSYCNPAVFRAPTNKQSSMKLGESQQQQQQQQQDE